MITIRIFLTCALQLILELSFQRVDGTLNSTYCFKWSLTIRTGYSQGHTSYYTQLDKYRKSHLITKKYPRVFRSTGLASTILKAQPSPLRKHYPMSSCSCWLILVYYCSLYSGKYPACTSSPAPGQLDAPSQTVWAWQRCKAKGSQWVTYLAN